MAKSQEMIILGWLSSGHTLTGLQARHKPFQSICLPRRIKTLRDSGHPIDMEWVKLPNNKRIGRYFIPKKKK